MNKWRKPVNQSDIECYRQALEAARAELMGRDYSAGSFAIERSPDPMEELVFASNRDMALEMLDRRAMLLRQVAKALERVRTGEYGVCRECREPISEKRLAALPWAALCLRCQEAADTANGAGAEARVNVGLWNAA